MPKRPLPPTQLPPSTEIPRTLRETYAAALGDAERELRAAQDALKVDDSNEARARYAASLANYDKLQSAFPFIASGMGDAKA